jgi:DNA-binding response OmpR family regulator
VARLLVIEDNTDVRKVITRMLKAAGHETREAENGIEGVAMVMLHPVDLVITDLLMPEQEGIETIQRIKEINRSMPIIAISGSGSEEFSPLHDAKLMGADLTIEKPFAIESLLASVTELLARGKR